MSSLQQLSLSVGLTHLAVPIQGKTPNTSAPLPFFSRFFSRTRQEPTDATTHSNSDHTSAIKGSEGESAPERGFCVVSRDFSAMPDSPSNQPTSSTLHENTEFYPSEQSDAIYAIMLKSTEHKKRVLSLQKENDLLKLQIKQLEEQLVLAKESPPFSGSHSTGQCPVTAENELEQHETLVGSLRAALEAEVDRRIEAEMVQAVDRVELLLYRSMHDQTKDVVMRPSSPSVVVVSLPLINAFSTIDNEDERLRLRSVVSDRPKVVEGSQAAYDAAEMRVEVVNQMIPMAPSPVYPASDHREAAPTISPFSTALERRDRLYVPKRCVAIRRAQSSRPVTSTSADHVSMHIVTDCNYSLDSASSQGGRAPFRCLDNGLALWADHSTHTPPANLARGGRGTLKVANAVSGVGHYSEPQPSV